MVQYGEVLSVGVPLQLNFKKEMALLEELEAV